MENKLIFIDINHYITEFQSRYIQMNIYVFPCLQEERAPVLRSIVNILL